MGSGLSTARGKRGKIRGAAFGIASQQRAAEEIAWQKMQTSMQTSTPAADSDVVEEEAIGDFDGFSFSQTTHGNETFNTSTRHILRCDRRDGIGAASIEQKDSEQSSAHQAAEGGAVSAHAPGCSNGKKDTSLSLSTKDRNQGLAPTWHSCGGAAIDALLKHTTLVDAEYLIDLASRGGIFPRCQQLPTKARITADTLPRLQTWAAPNSLPILVLSYPWLDTEQ